MSCVTRDDYQSAQEKAKALLRRVLPPAQWRAFASTGRVSVLGRSFRYDIDCVGRTALYDHWGVRRGVACLQLAAPAPAYDRVLAEYLILINDERFYLRTANVVRDPLSFRELVLIAVVVASAVFAFLKFLAE